MINRLREWKLRCPKGPLDPVFPNGRGNIQRNDNIIRRLLKPTLIAGRHHRRGGQAEIHRLHSLRHFYASWCINRKADGGLELPGKVVQERLGHSSVTMTMDGYATSSPAQDDGPELADAELKLLG